MKIFEVNAKLESLAEKRKDSFSLEENKLKTIEGISGIIHGISRKDREEIYHNIGLAYTSMYFAKDTVEKLDLNREFSGVFKEELDMNGDPKFRQGLRVNFSNASIAMTNLESLITILVKYGYNFHFCFGLISSMLSLSTLFDIDFVEAIKSFIEFPETTDVKIKKPGGIFYSLEEKLPDCEVISIVFDDKCIKDFAVNTYTESGPWTFNDVLKRAKKNGYTEGVITVLLEDYRNGYVFMFGNYDKEKFYHVGITQGFA